MNHSFEPNCIIKDNCIVALKSINEGDELTFNYNDNETKIVCPFFDSKTNIYVTGETNKKFENTITDGYGNAFSM